MKRSVQLTKWHGHSILLDTEFATLRSHSEVSYLCWPGMWCIGQLYILFWILSESSTAYCLSWRHLHWFDIVFIVLLTLCSLFSPSDENRQLETLGEEFELAEDIWWREHIKLWVLEQQDALALWGQWPYLSILFVWGFVWWDVSVLWGQYLHHRHRALWLGVYHLQGRHRCSLATLIIAYKNNLILIRLYFTLWIGYYSGRKTTAIQLYLADLHCECRTEHSILHWRLKLWDAISMRKADLEMERCVLTMFSIQKKVVQRTFCEPLRSWEVSQLANGLVIHVWMRTSLLWELLEVFRSFWIHLVEKLVCRLIAAGIVSTNLYLKNMRFVNWKPGIEFTSWDIGSREWCQKFI